MYDQYDQILFTIDTIANDFLIECEYDITALHKAMLSYICRSGTPYGLISV